MKIRSAFRSIILAAVAVVSVAAVADAALTKITRLKLIHAVQSDTLGNALQGALNGVDDVIFTVTTDQGIAGIAVTATYYDLDDQKVAGSLFCYLSADSGGRDIATTQAGITNGTDGEYIALVTSKAGYFISETTGEMDITLLDPDADNYYLACVLPDGSLDVSTVIDFVL